MFQRERTREREGGGSWKGVDEKADIWHDTDGTGTQFYDTRNIMSRSRMVGCASEPQASH